MIIFRTHQTKKQKNKHKNVIKISLSVLILKKKTQDKNKEASRLYAELTSVLGNLLVMYSVIYRRNYKFFGNLYLVFFCEVNDFFFHSNCSNVVILFSQI